MPKTKPKPTEAESVMLAKAMGAQAFRSWRDAGIPSARTSGLAMRYANPFTDEPRAQAFRAGWAERDPSVLDGMWKIPTRAPSVSSKHKYRPRRIRESA